MSYVVVNKYHTRMLEDGKVEVFEVGDQIDPTEDELKSFPDRFREVEHTTTRRRRQSEPTEPESTGLFSGGSSKDADKV